MLVIMYGSINQAKLAWDIGDLGGLMAWFYMLLSCCKNQLGLERLRKQKKEGKILSLILEILELKMRTFGIP
jgi:AGCS family alanine or glycine:cation symporter